MHNQREWQDRIDGDENCDEGGDKGDGQPLKY